MNSSLHLVPKRSARNGFTLIELMVTVVIIGILAAIVVPSYRNYVLEGKVPLATSGLASEQVQMEQWFQDNNSYLNVAANPAACTSAGNSTNNPYFTFSCVGTNTATTYTLQAQGIGSMAGFTYTLNNLNVRATTASPWGGSNASCWIIRPGGKC